MKTNSPLVSIITLNWNGLEYLKQNLPLILDLDYSNYEVIVVENGSCDGTGEFLRKIKDKRLKIIYNQENLGTSKARNQGAAIAKGQYILFLDNDIDIGKNKRILQDLMAVYEKCKNPAFLLVPLIDKEYLSAMKTRKYGAFYTWYGIKRNEWKTMDEIRKWANPVAEIQTCFSGDMFIAKKIWDVLGGFDESQTFNSDDDDIGIRATVYGYKNYIYGQYFFVHMGEERRKDNKMYADYFKLSYSGKARALVKNMQAGTLLYMLPMYTLFSLGVAVKQSVQRLYPGVFFAFVSSFVRFIRVLPDTLRERKTIQKRRKVSDTEFLRLSTRN